MKTEEKKHVLKVEGLNSHAPTNVIIRGACVDVGVGVRPYWSRSVKCRDAASIISNDR